jgi:hypothetical protein
MLMLFLGISSVTQARTGNTSDNDSKSHKSTTTPKPEKTTSATNSAFANTAKTNAAKNAWQERNKKVDTPVATVTTPHKPDDNANKTNEQLADIQKKIAENNRNQKIIAAAQVAAQAAAQALFNKQRTTTINQPPVTPNNTVATTTVPPVTNPVQTTTTPTTTPVNTAKPASGGTSWFMILLIGGGILCVIIYFVKYRPSSDTNYRL